MDLSIVIVNWNSSDFLLECLASIRTHTGDVNYEIIVVDNASSEQDVARLPRDAANTIILRSRDNLGFARANNLGFRHSSGEYVLFLNPDTKLAGPAIDTMLDQAKRLPDAGIIGCRLLNTDLSLQLSAVRRFPTIINQMLDAEYLQARWPNCRLWSIGALFSGESGPVEVEAVSGACMLMKSEVFLKVGMFSEDYFMYAEDVDLNCTVKLAGFTNYYLGDAVIIHHGGRSSSRQESSGWAVTMRMNATWRFMKKTRGHAYAFAFRVAMACCAVARISILGLGSYFASRANRENRILPASSKWKAVLHWALNPTSSRSANGATGTAAMSKKDLVREVFENPRRYFNDRQYDVRIRAETVRSLAKGLASKRVLDIGCGDGSISLPLVGPPTTLTLIDFSANMLSIARSNVPHDLTGNVEFINGDFMAESFAPASFDLIVCLGVIAHVESPEDFVARIATLLKPTGRLILEFTDSFNFAGRVSRFIGSLREFIAPPHYSVNRFSRDKVVDLMGRHGFRLISQFQFGEPPFPGIELLSHRIRYKIVRQINGTVEKNRNTWWGNEYICLLTLDAPCGSA